MDQDSNYITVELNLRFSMKDYRIVVGLKRTWILTMIVATIQLLVWVIKGHG